jgi:AcrR family transcriptional regulator
MYELRPLWAELMSTVRRSRTRGSALVPVSPTLRRPAKELGPRANLTIARILDATRQIFLTRGYTGTTIDEITRLANVSRASFYTYFPSKRDVLLALGADSAAAGRAVIERLVPGNRGSKDKLVLGFVREYFALLDDQGSFAFAWTQAAQEDEEIRRAGMKGHLQLCRQLGETLGLVLGRPFDNPTVHGLATFSMLERAWSYGRLYAGTIDQDALQRDIARTLAAASKTS